MSADLAVLGLEIDGSSALSAATSLDRFSGAAGKSQAAADALAATTVKTGASVKGMGAAFDATVSPISSNSAAMAALTGRMGSAATAADHLRNSITAHGRAVNDNVSTVARATKAHHDHAEGLGAASSAAAELTHIIRSLGDQMAAGQDPLRAFQVEGGRIFQLLSGGQLGGAVVGMMSKLALLANPLALGAAGFAGLGVAALTAAGNVASARAEMDRAVTGVGAFAGLTGSALGRLADQRADALGLTRGDARTGAAALAQTGRLDAGNIGRAFGLGRGYAGAYGGTPGEGAASLGELLSDPLKGLDRLNERFGFLDAATRSYVETLVRQGREQEAVRVAIDAASTSLNTMAQPQGSWDRFTSWWSKRNAEVEQLLSQTPQDPLVQAYRDEAQSSGFGMLNIMKRNSGVANNLAEDIRNRAILRGDSPLTLPPAADIIANRQSLDAQKLSRTYAPEATALKDLTDDYRKLSDALGNPETVKRMGDSAASAMTAVNKLALGISTFATEAEKTRQGTAFAVAAISADDAATRTLIETQRVYATTLQSTRDAAQAAAEAERVRAEAVASAQKRLDDSARSARDAAAMIGLNPYQRILAEGRQAIEALKRDSVIPAGVAVPAGGVGVPLGGGFDAAARRTLGFEGGLLPSDTNGTPTRYGINAANNPGVDLSTLTVDGARDIYRRKYWDPLNLAGASPGLQRVAFDTSIMEGPARANDFIRRSGGDADAFMDLRQGFEASLLRKDPAKYGLFATSWANRDAALRLDLGKSGTMEGTPAGSAGTNAADAIAARQALTGAQTADLFAAPLRDASKQLDAMERSQRELGTGFGMTSDKVAGITERLKLENDLISAGARSLDPYATQLDAVQSRWERVTKATDDARQANARLVGAMDDVRDGARGFLDPLAQAAVRGTSLVDALKSSLQNVSSKLLGRAEDAAIDGLFGARGTAGGASPGLFGGFLSGLFGGPKFAGGGVMTSAGPMALRAYAGGGVATSPQLALYGEGSQPEAFVPLPDGRRIPVAMQGGGAGGGDSYTHAPVYNIDARGSTLSREEVRDALVQAIAANNAQRDNSMPEKIRKFQQRAG